MRKNKKFQNSGKIHLISLHSVSTETQRTILRQYVPLFWRHKAPENQDSRRDFPSAVFFIWCKIMCFLCRYSDFWAYFLLFVLFRLFIQKHFQRLKRRIHCLVSCFKNLFAELVIDGIRQKSLCVILSGAVIMYYSSSDEL